MLGDASDFTPIDLLGSLAVNAVGTNIACQSDTFRTGVKNAAGQIPAWADFRFLGGVAAAGIAQFGGPMVRRAGHDAAVGLLGSYVATETCRRHALAKIQQGGGAAPAQIPGQQAAPQPAPATTQGAPAGYGYGW